MSGQQTVDLSKVAIAEAALARVPARLARRYGLLPVALEGETLTVAQANPDDPIGVMELESRLGMRVRTVTASRPEAVARAIERYYAGAAGDETPTALAALERLVNRAIQIHCSDIHLDPEEGMGVARMRVDGMMRVVSEYPPAFMADLISAVKVAARLDISERRAPQDGQIVMDSLGESIAMRVAVIPTTHGEKVTLRILATAAVSEELDRLDALGMSEMHYGMMRAALEQAYGVILLSGPTGSGKTTTLYAALRHLREPGTQHILTIENPVEIPLKGVNQIQIDGERVSFAKALRSVLRHDPDIVMIGEIRDPETADIAVKSALTGHIVLATLHANTSVSVITRLLNLGVSRELAASTLRLVVAQRLVRRPCPHCVVREPATEAQCAEFGWNPAAPPQVARARGCAFCGQLGYAGRLGLYEMTPVDRALRDLVVADASEDSMADFAFEQRKLPTLAQDGADKVAAGLTTPEEVRRVTFVGEVDV
ncbi:GspE/PulE family protein [Kiritimatiella glycovorans]|uniref:Type IV-A pilus assembly ATPase PilB n=1 Tax=Kiritimatiella glycovorans TaxID=1307763 RepID=A0A0G3EJ82_9BACT|nr:GspE/PulE family protein [Kiritimatiella glycovorans]AKJ64835.1 Type IV-A pilus assembly ATPase PilB [Kiritimatiella glycovorans]